MKKPVKKGQRIEIRPAKINGKPTGFRVVTIARNGEVLSTSEVLTSPANVRKNLVALWNLIEDATDSISISARDVTLCKTTIDAPIIDLTAKVIKPTKK